MRTVSQLKPSQSIEITNIKDKSLAVQLFSMGILPGKKIKMIRKNILNRSCIVEVSGTQYALRHYEATQIEIA